MDKQIKNKKKYHHTTVDPNYRIPIVPYVIESLDLIDSINIKKTTFPTIAFEAGVLNIPQMIDLKKSSVINKPDAEFYKKYYEVKNKRNVSTKLCL